MVQFNIKLVGDPKLGSTAPKHSDSWTNAPLVPFEDRLGHP